MGEVWTVVGVVGAATIVMKGIGPTVLGGRTLPPRVMSVVELLAPAVLAALVVTQAVGAPHRLAFDARLVGLSAAAIAIWLRAPVLLTVVVAAVATALWRLVV